MAISELKHGVWLYDDHVGTLSQRGDYTSFRFDDDYLSNPGRAVLGLVFEQDLFGRYASALRLPPWFSNLLPEGRLRAWIAEERGVSADREMELLAQVGGDLPGAVRVLPDQASPSEFKAAEAAAASSVETTADTDELEWRFSLAGVGLKFSMLRAGDNLTLPAFGRGGDWIVKLPEPSFRDVPLNEHTMMSLADAAGIEIPEHMLVHRDQLEGLPDEAWQGAEQYAYAVRRFDRGANRELIHIEDFAQVRNIYPDWNQKYQGHFETVAGLAYRGRDTESLREVARRLAFNILISNGDAHLKNWSLIYRDLRVPSLSPAYDLVSTAFYRVSDREENMGLKFGGTRRFDKVSLSTFDRMGTRLNAGDADLAAHAAATVEQVMEAWSNIASALDSNPELQDSIDRSIKARAQTLLRV